MSVKKNKDGSVTIKQNNGVAVIGRITTAVDNKRKYKFNQWVEDCAKKVTACAHTFRETEQYFLDLCDALPLAADDRRIKTFHLNVVMNNFKDKLEHQAPVFSFDMTDVEMEKWHEEENAMREEALNASPESFGLIIRGYYLPHFERNEVFYEGAYVEARERMNHSNLNIKRIEINDICVFFEETTENLHCSGSVNMNDLMQQLIVYRGISEDDIEKRNQRFLAYISALRDMGSLPDFREK